MICCLMTGSLFFAPFLFVFSVVNSIAISYGSSAALPFSTILAMCLLWAFITFPLTLYGSYKGMYAEKIDYPCRIKYIPRPLPTDLPWYLFFLFFRSQAEGFVKFFSSQNWTPKLHFTVFFKKYPNSGWWNKLRKVLSTKFLFQLFLGTFSIKNDYVKNNINTGRIDRIYFK